MIRHVQIHTISCEPHLFRMFHLRFPPPRRRPPPTPPRATAAGKVLHVALAKKKKEKTLHLLRLSFFSARVCTLLTQPMCAPILLESHLMLAPENPQVATPAAPSRKRCSFHTPYCLASFTSFWRLPGRQAHIFHWLQVHWR